MITIVKGTDKIVCTKGTFEEQYKSLGYQIASEKKEATKKVASIVSQEKRSNEIEEEKEREELNEKYGLKKTTKKGK